MRRTSGAAASTMCCRACVVPLATTLITITALWAGPGVAHAEPAGPESVASLVAAVANANQKLQDLGASVQTQQESVNKALVDVQNARDAAATAQHQVDVSRQAVQDADAAITAAQKRFDTFAAATYVHGPSSSYLTASDPADMLDTAATGQALAISTQQVMTDLQRARTEQLNKESAARLAKQKADQAAADAKASQDSAVSALTSAKHEFGEQQAQLDQLTAERAQAQAKLDAARKISAPTGGPAASTPAASAPAASTPAGRTPSGDPAADWDRKPGAAPPYGDVSQWDTTLPMIPSAFVSGDPIAIINAVLKIMQTSAQVTAELGRQFLTKLGIIKPADTGITNGAIPRVYGQQASEYVIKRALSQRGVPYSWGGGNAAGPSRGIDSGAGTTGFDCSGLILYAFAGVGIKLPHYSGSQYNMGRKIPASQMRRGDVIFYGPGGSQHVTLYLGNGQMLEAPYTGSVVKVSPVRTSGMTPYVVRYIEY